MVNITKSTLQFSRKAGKSQVCGQVGKAITPCAPPCESSATQEGSSKLAALDIIGKSSSVHVLLDREEEVGQFGGGTIKILRLFHFYGFLGKHICGGCTSLLCGSSSTCLKSLDLGL